jgi:hypothetical protein
MEIILAKDFADIEMGSPPRRFGDLENSTCSETDGGSQHSTPRVKASSLPPSNSSQLATESAINPVGPTVRIPRKTFNAMLPTIQSPASYYRAEEAHVRAELQDSKIAAQNLMEIQAKVMSAIASLDAQIQAME